MLDILTYCSQARTKLVINLCVSVCVSQSFPTLCDPTDGSLPGSSVHGILQARIL